MGITQWSRGRRIGSRTTNYRNCQKPTRDGRRTDCIPGLSSDPPWRSETVAISDSHGRRPDVRHRNVSYPPHESVLKLRTEPTAGDGVNTSPSEECGESDTPGFTRATSPTPNCKSENSCYPLQAKRQCTSQTRRCTGTSGNRM